MVYHENDDTFGVTVYKSKSRKYLVIACYSTLTNEYHILNANTPDDNFKVFQKETHLKILSPADWLRSDRINCTIVWQQANKSNLENNRPKEYNNLAQRRDFYNWLYLEAIRQGHEVVWFKMVHYISKKYIKTASLVQNLQNFVVARK